MAIIQETNSCCPNPLKFIQNLTKTAKFSKDENFDLP